MAAKLGIADPTGIVLDVSLPNDKGKALQFKGELIGEEMCFDDDTGMLTIEKLYENDDNELAYSIISAIGHHRARRSYILSSDGDAVTVDNGSLKLSMDIEPLLELLQHAVENDRTARTRNYDHVARKLAVNE